jgi:Spx/MgsR family transcriptional regulator
MSKYLVYGIKNCNTVKKALDFLNSKSVDYQFYDYKKSGISLEKLQNWAQQIGYEKLLNKNGTTWKQIDESLKNQIIDQESTLSFLVTKTSAIKRPIVELDGKIVAIGFNEEIYLNQF